MTSDIIVLTMHGSHMDWKNEKTFPVREKSGNFEQTGEVYLLKIFRFLYLFNSFNKTLKKYWKIKRKCWKSQGNLGGGRSFPLLWLSEGPHTDM